MRPGEFLRQVRGADDAKPKGIGSDARAPAGAPQLPTTAVPCRENPSFVLTPFPHPLRFKAPLPRKELETHRRSQWRQKERAGREIDGGRWKNAKPRDPVKFQRQTDGQTKWLAEVAREGLSPWPLRDGRADGAGGGGRRAREARRVRGRFCRRPRPAVPAARRLISHLAAPGPVCAEPGIPPAAQPAPAPSSPPPRFLAAAR